MYGVWEYYGTCIPTIFMHSAPSGWIPQSTQYGVMHYATSNNYHNTRTRGPENPLEQATQLCPNKLNEAFLDYWNPLVSYPNISQ